MFTAEKKAEGGAWGSGRSRHWRAGACRSVHGVWPWAGHACDGQPCACPPKGGCHRRRPLCSLSCNPTETGARPGSGVTIYRWHITYSGHFDLSLTIILKDSNHFLKLPLREFQYLACQTTKTTKPECISLFALAARKLGFKLAISQQ